ncbi:hypothetical protein [Seleniivibrio sp.]|uniref:hypothetical protein n=1 Tax=Seleniivibrio sp. TaxID=2898801 RepID=UPI0025D3E895|nr:hypothetical protein [Seleniivibrio sp.]MCD8554126.1 hypothetical protein [Seleniivibrio sp.]
MKQIALIFYLLLFTVVSYAGEVPYRVYDPVAEGYIWLSGSTSFRMEQDFRITVGKEGIYFVREDSDIPLLRHRLDITSDLPKIRAALEKSLNWYEINIKHKYEFKKPLYSREYIKMDYIGQKHTNDYVEVTLKTNDMAYNERGFVTLSLTKKQIKELLNALTDSNIAIVKRKVVIRINKNKQIERATMKEKQDIDNTFK